LPLTEFPLLLAFPFAKAHISPNIFFVQVRGVCLFFFILFFGQTPHRILSPSPPTIGDGIYLSSPPPPTFLEIHFFFHWNFFFSLPVTTNYPFIPPFPLNLLFLAISGRSLFFCWTSSIVRFPPLHFTWKYLFSKE